MDFRIPFSEGTYHYNSLGAVVGPSPEVFDKAYIAVIVSSIGRFVAVDERTRSYSNPSYARACIEIDITKLPSSELVINILGDKTIMQPIVSEGKLLYCSKCKLHGHQLSTYQKLKPPTPLAPHVDPSALQSWGEVTEVEARLVSTKVPNLSEEQEINDALTREEEPIDPASTMVVYKEQHNGDQANNAILPDSALG
ncbi:hypothetical protein QQ045_017827 [Rhodiola kirilowii]